MRAYFEGLYKGGIDRLMSDLTESLEKGKKRFVITANPEIYMQAEKYPELRRLFTDSNTIVADGIGVVKVCRRLGVEGVEKIPGVDISRRLLEEGSRLGCGAVFLGAKREVSEKFTDMVAKKYPGIKILGAVDGYAPDLEGEFKDLLAKRPDIVLVALGVPKQELLIDKYFGDCEKGVFVGVGGTFDVLSGVKKRAPKLFLKTDTEWLYRIITEPNRLGRFFRNNVRFMLSVKRWDRDK